MNFAFLTTISTFFSANKAYVIGAGALIAISAVTGGYFYVRNLQADNVALTNQVVLLNGSIDAQKLTIKGLQDDVVKINTAKNKIDDVKQTSQKKLDKLSHVFAGKNLGQLANEKPDLIEVSINKGTADTLRCIEILTGQEVKQNETNSMCPDYLSK